MSITINVRSDGTTTQQTLNGDGAIDTKTEAEDALLFATKDGDTVETGGKTYTRQDLIDLRDGKENSSPELFPKISIDQLVTFNGEGGKGLGKWSHNSGGFEMAYAHRLWSSETSPVSVWGKAGAAVNVNDWDFQTPGGEDANSHFTRFGATAGGSIDVNPKGGKAHIGVGLNGSLSGFSSPQSTIVQTPGECVPGDLGQGECEPGAGPQTGNAGTTGVYNPDEHNSEGAHGLALTAGLNVSLGVDVPTKSETGLRLFGYVEPRATYVSDRHPFGFMGLSFGGGLAVAFGKPVAPTAPSSEPASAPVAAQQSAVAQGEAFSLGAPSGGWKTGDEVWVNGEKMIDPAVPTSGSDAYKVPADKLKADGTNVIEILRGGKPLIRYEVRVNPPVAMDTSGNASSNGFTLAQVLKVDRPALVAGQAPAPLNIGSVVAEAGIPAGMKVEIRIDNEKSGTPIDLVADGKTQLTVPAAVADGTHTVEFRILDKTGAVKHRFVGQPMTIGPAIATLTNVSVVTPPSVYSNDPIKLNLSTTKATKATVTITDNKGRSTNVSVDIPATIPAGGLIIVGQSVAKTLPVRGLCTFSITPEGGTTTAVMGSVTINGKVPGTGTGKPKPAPTGMPSLSGKKH